MHYSFPILSFFRYADLKRRFETPNASNRWDYPLFVANMTPPDSSRIPSGDIRDTTQPAAAAPTAVAAPAGQSGAASSAKTSSFRRAPSKHSATASPAAREEKPAAPEDAGLAPVAPTASLDRLTFSGRFERSAAAEQAGCDSGAGPSSSSPDECCAQVLQHLLNSVAPLPNPATVATPHANADLLYLLDKTSQEVLNTIMSHQNKDCGSGNPVIFREFDRVLELHRIVSFAELQRHRRQFVKVNSQIPPSSEIVIGTAFIDFLALQL
jgi:tRNA uridine 5-carbamoylmethylation protein Kti12